MNSPLRIASPTTTSEFAQRDHLLTLSLRENSLQWPYAEEYPLVLAPSAANTSWCLFDGDQLSSHANLWLRRLSHVSQTRSHSVAFIGNVATAVEHRGRGHMQRLFAHLADIAQSQGASVLVLWSDLLEFYQNLGFASNGSEIRYQFKAQDRKSQTGIQVVQDIQSLSDSDLSAMLSRRPKLEWSIDRSVEEFRRLLGIPATHLFLRRKGSQIASWLVIGKGSDMLGVIHEWGAISPDELAADIHCIMQSHELPELLLLAPSGLHGHWHKVFELRSARQTRHPMALVKALGDKSVLQDLAQGFIWGLDSI